MFFFAGVARGVFTVVEGLEASEDVGAGLGLGEIVGVEGVGTDWADLS